MSANLSDVVAAAKPHQPWSETLNPPPLIRLRTERLAEKLGRTLLLLPHYDDECAAGALLRQLPDATVVFLTDGAPRDPYFWQSYGSREAYSALRKRESAETLAAAGIRSAFCVDELSGFAPTDQELYQSLPEVFSSIKNLATRISPGTILAPAFEGGHPDHDAASFLAAQLARQLRAEHWELPYYHRRSDGRVCQQEFLEHLPHACEVTLALSGSEIQEKRAMWSRYRSQCAVLGEFEVEREVYRPAPSYEWRRPPHRGTLNYEAWHWQVRGADLAEAFVAALSVIG